MTRSSARLRRSAAIVGIGHTDWAEDHRLVKAGRAPFDSTGYAAAAFSRALADSGVSKDEINGLIVGPPCTYDRVSQALGLNAKWGATLDVATAILQACAAIECGFAEVIALVHGNDQRSAGTQYGGTDAMGADVQLSYVYHAPWGFTSQGAIYAMLFERYCQVTGFDRKDLGHVSISQRAWAALNSSAIMRSPISFDDYLAAPYICEPLRLLDYCLVNDGGVALIITDADRAKSISQKPVYIESIGRYEINRGMTELEPHLTDFFFSAQRNASTDSYETAGVGPEDIDMLQIYDSFSVHVPLVLEGYGYCPRGDAGRFLREVGTGPNGKLPINTSGGHLSESYMQGWAHQVECVKQLRGACGRRQVEDLRYVQYASDMTGKSTSIIYTR